MKKGKIRKEVNKLLFVLPSMVGIIIFYLLSLCYCFLYSFSGTSGRFRYNGFKNYVTLFQSKTFRMAFGNTYLMMILFIGILMVISLFFVYYLDTSKGTLGILLMCSLPMLLPATLIVRCVEAFSISPRLVLLLIFLWKYTGLHILLLKIMEMTMKPEWIEVAVLEHASKWQMFAKVKCYYLWPFIRFLFIFDGICFFRLFRESFLLYGKYPPDEVYMISNFFFNNFQNLNYQRLATASVVALIPLWVLNGILLKVGGNHEMV